MTNDEKIQLLAQKMLILSNNIDKYKNELESLKQQLELLKQGTVQPVVKPVINEIRKTEPLINKEEPVQKPVEVVQPVKEEPKIPVQQLAVPQQKINPAQPAKSFNIEEYIGGKLMSIIGIVILVIGIAFGVKYAIDKDLINPLTRIIFGFLAGGILLTVAFLLKKKYSIFSAIILSGAVATMFFTTFVGFALYELYPRGFAFALMFIIMAFTVFCAHAYNYEIIALIGLVGAYAIPPMLSDGSGRIEYMFTYMAIINCGILILSFIKHWKWVNYCAYALTWLIVSSWISAKYNSSYFTVAFAFSTIFFLTFYIAFIAYKILKKINFTIMDIVTLMSNSFIFFGLGYYMLNDEYHQQYQGLFCVFNALIHLGVAMLAHKNKVADKNILFFILGLVFTFITIAVPVQLEGHWVTLIWFTEMLMLFWLGRKFDVPFYNYISYILSLLGIGSLFHDWSTGYGGHYDYATSTTVYLNPLFNNYFLVTVYSMCALAGVLLVNHRFLAAETERKKDQLWWFAKVSSVVFLVIVSYSGFLFELLNYFEKWYHATSFKMNDNGYAWEDYDRSIPSFKILWALIYTLGYTCIAGLLNYRFFKSRVIAWFSWSAILFSLLLMLFPGIYILGELRELYFDISNNYQVAWRSDWDLNFRYVFIPFIVLGLLTLQLMQRSEQLKAARALNLWFMHGIILVVLSNQLSYMLICSHPDDQYHYAKVSYRMGYTILWALYSTSLIVFGIARKVKMLRIMGIALFGLTIIKLLIDSVTLSRGYQLVVYCSVGVILLCVGFLYQRFKQVLFGEDETTDKNLPNE